MCSNSMLMYDFHNVSNIVFYFVCLAKYHCVVIDEKVDGRFEVNIYGVEERYDWIKFFEI